MTRGQVKRRLSFNWWQYLALALLPLFVINLLFGRAESLLPVLAMPFFIAGVASMFLSLRYFHAYKHALIGSKAQALVGLDGVGAAVLQFVGANLVKQADATALLTQIQQHATAFAGDGLQSGLQLRTTVAALAEQRIAGQAFGMQAPQYRLAIGYITQAEHNVLAAGGFVEKTMHGERGKGGGQLGSGNKDDGHLVLLINNVKFDVRRL